MLMAHYKVKDTDVFDRVFAEFQPARQESGATGHRVLHAVDDPEIVVVLIEFPDHGSAAAFAADPRRADALERASVIERSDLVLEGDPAVAY
jgi:uncharacterized protein (DUF1330 family)